MSARRRLLAAVDTAIAWPTTPVSVTFLAHEISLCPESETEPDRVEMQLLVGESTDDALSVLNRFMSALAWAEGKRLRIAQWMLFGGPGGTMRKGAAKFNSNGLVTRAKTIIIDYLPAPVGEDQQLALALYREALNNNSIAYSFLSFVKVINIKFDKGRSQKAWINATIPKLTRNHDHSARERIAQLTGDLGVYFYRDGRCAVAHAYEKGRVNPDIAWHERRLAQDLPVVQALAEYLIEYELGVSSQGSVWDEHLYELEGFRALLGPSLVGRLKQKMDVAATDLPGLPPLGIRARGGDVHPSLEDLTPSWVMAVDGSLCLILANDCWPVRVLLRLNFPAERLDFDVAGMIEITEVGTVAAEEARRHRSDLMRSLLRNAQLHVCRSDTGQLMGRTDGFLPNDAQYRGMKALLLPETS